MDGVSVAKSLHHFVEATSLYKAPFPNQRDLDETAMGHGTTSSPKLCTIVGSQKVKEQSASIRESAVKFGVASAGNKESMNHLSHLLRVSEFKILQHNFAKLYGDGSEPIFI